MTTIEFHWWYLAVVLAPSTLPPMFRALAAILVGRLMPPKLAKMAIPLVLRPVRPALLAWPWQNGQEKHLKESASTEHASPQQRGSLNS
jgi:hypothetical protein